MAFQLKTEPGSPPDFTFTTHRNYQEISISGLVSELRFAYEVEHYDRVEVELVKRDTKLKSDIGSLHEKILEERCLRTETEKSEAKRLASTEHCRGAKPSFYAIKSDRSEKVISNRSEEFVKDGPGVLVNDSSEKVVSDRAGKVVRNNRSTKKIVNDRSQVVVNNSSEKWRQSKGYIYSERFHPLRVHPLWNRNGHSGYAIVEFSKNWEGFTNAINFERNFEAERCSKKDYYNLRHQGDTLYGWVYSKYDDIDVSLNRAMDEKETMIEIYNNGILKLEANCLNSF
ncbi:hypothetical protein Fmac_014347 [Flemingia macrophylla]|uniref:XS domain-containing protein n=1 Tax=Flemingia macrophylla TaxID=520843 RepID=A0ABD1MBI6_9FABA